MVATPQDDDQGKVEALVYFVVSSDEGPGHRIFEEENVVASGGVGTVIWAGFGENPARAESPIRSPI